jgi:hypothetical protein
MRAKVDAAGVTMQGALDGDAKFLGLRPSLDLLEMHMKIDQLTRSPNSDPSELFRYRDGIRAPELLGTAVTELDFFSWLAKSPTDAKADLRLARARGSPGDVTKSPGNFASRSRAPCMVNQAESSFARIDNETPVILCCPVLRIGRIRFLHLLKLHCGGAVDVSSP